ncbi:Serine/threonine protein kinase [methanotrophic endosymbiont of Bathymodiolus azoricus (Menez Gwen)]|nr:Serine/threonine protein kinase [methanotrophic endosymbiont of Bathymodiolus azoricus (Menez Gwen)]
MTINPAEIIAASGNAFIETEEQVDRRAILPYEILGTPVTKYSLTYGANWISPSTPCVRFNFAQKPLR